ncbi:MAG: amidase [Caballeronia sp.]|uniref:acetamidase/formamidase family protein n=1 Tax=Caballeronia sp. TaxID=1931223 RepID=UPI00261E5A28|nr:acetamidase/formamidase family protein [Caballeronia sp.]MDB5833644.1 amidase [Caballeronia sp.]
MSESHVLTSSPDTVHWGFFDSALAPVLTIRSGDEVRIETVNGQPRDLVGLPFEMLPEHQAIHRDCTPKLGPHIVTGPIAVDGAQSGDLLEVRVVDIELRQDWGWNAIRPLRGTLPDDFPITQLLHVPIDRSRNVATLPFGPRIPLRPFFGIMGVAPPPAYGAISSIEPREHGGNIDNKELGVGAIVYFPVHVPGALFSVGDGHAVQGDGEVDLSALETSLTGVFRLTIHRGIEASLPFAITQRHVITMGFDEDLDEAARKALREMIQLIGRATGWPHASAYAFCSMACDLRITQMVDGEKGVHAMVEHSLLTPHLSKPYLALKPQSPDA